MPTVNASAGKRELTSPVAILTLLFVLFVLIVALTPVLLPLHLVLRLAGKRGFYYITHEVSLTPYGTHRVKNRYRCDIDAAAFKPKN